MNKRIRWLRSAMMLALILMSLLPVLSVAAQTAEQQSRADGNKLVYSIPVHQTIESGLQKFLERSIAEAEQNNASLIILDLDTLGGRVDAALDIGRLIRESKVPTVAFVHGKAISAGSYIALNSGKIVMERGSSIGAAAVVDASGKEVDSPKVIAFWKGEMKAAAEIQKRNPQIAEKMVDKNMTVSVPELGRTYEKGELISLSAEDALKAGYAEKVVGSRSELLNVLGYADAQVYEVQPTLAEKLARFLTNGIVSTILLLVGIAGIGVELLLPGHAVSGVLGLTAFGLYFFGHYAAGFAGTEDIFLFVIGVLLMIAEVFIPGFGILAIAGIVCLASSVILAAYDSSNAAVSLGIASAAALVLIVLVAYYFRHKGIWNKFILKDALKTELGYVSTSSKEHLLGKKGVAITPLRPAGIAKIEGGRVDVVTSGEFVESRKEIEVVQIEGTRVVVREVVEDE